MQDNSEDEHPVIVLVVGLAFGALAHQTKCDGREHRHAHEILQRQLG